MSPVHLNFNSHCEQHFVKMVICVWKMGLMKEKDVSKCAKMEHGELSAMTDGIQLMLVWFAGNLIIQESVSQLFEMQ